MRFVKKLRELLRIRRTRQKVAPPMRNSTNESPAPKNGRLTLAVVAVLTAMVVLAALNVRLILDPSIAGKAFGPWVPVKPESEASGASCPSTETKPNASPPQVTFYSKLVAQEEQNHCPEEAGTHQTATPDNSVPASPKKSTGHEEKSAEKHADKKGGNRQPLEAQKDVHAGDADAALPGPDSGPGTYMVQVGAFTHPAIAQQWAARWKSRGFEVILKPVARPRTGILYRLYLGKFSSQQEADALVKRLKMREGITAFRLLVRN